MTYQLNLNQFPILTAEMGDDTGHDLSWQILRWDHDDRNIVVGGIGKFRFHVIAESPTVDEGEYVEWLPESAEAVAYAHAVAARLFPPVGPWAPPEPTSTSDV